MFGACLGRVWGAFAAVCCVPSTALAAQQRQRKLKRCKPAGLRAQIPATTLALGNSMNRGGFFAQGKPASRLITSPRHRAAVTGANRAALPLPDVPILAPSSSHGLATAQSSPGHAQSRDKELENVPALGVKIAPCSSSRWEETCGRAISEGSAGNLSWGCWCLMDCVRS